MLRTPELVIAMPSARAPRPSAALERLVLQNVHDRAGNDSTVDRGGDADREHR